MVHEENDIKAVIFDMGGVILQYNDMETFVKLISTVEKHPVLAKAMERLEIGELTLEDAPTIAKECIEAEPETKAIFDLLKPKEFSNHLSTCPYFAEALKQIRSAGLQTALLTNNFYVDTARTKSTVLPNAEDKFDVVVESCREGLRKPDPQIYEVALQKLGRKPEECVFVDDLLKNCETAEKLGMRAVQVKKADAKGAVEELQVVLGISLLEN